MPKYKLTLEFDSEDDAEAKDLIWNENYGVTSTFDSIHTVELTNAETGEEVEE